MPKPDPPHKRLTIQEVMAYTRISRRTFYRWVKRGALKAVRVNGSLRVHPNELRRITKKYTPKQYRDD